MKIAVFCDSIKRLPEFRARFAGDGVHFNELLFIICNNARNSTFSFVARQLWNGRRYRLKDCIDLVQDLLSNRLCVTLEPLGSKKNLAFLLRRQPDLGLHAMGVIYPEKIIATCRLGILNAHIGQLPKFRGRSVFEWSILCGDVTGVTVFFINAGIDTGRKIVLWEPISVKEFLSIYEAKRYLFSLDLELYYKAVERIRGGAPFECNDVTQGLRFYEMSLLFRAELTTYFERER